ncbi:MAG: OmpA family protein [Geminicoccaceae bacterium]
MLAVAAAVVSTGSAQAAEALTNLTTAPLVLKDGRTADVTIRTVSFAPGSAAIDPATQAALQTLAADIADDCFLSAQAIGHAERAADGDADPTLPFRLAQDRADSVREVLVGNGLGESAVASVGDAQLVREPQVTLWVYRLRPEFGCEDRPLGAPAVASLVDPSDGSAGVPIPEKKAEVPKRERRRKEAPAAIAEAQMPEEPAPVAPLQPAPPAGPKPVVSVMQPIGDPEPAAGPEAVPTPAPPQPPKITVAALEPPKVTAPAPPPTASPPANVRLANAPLPPLKDGTSIEIAFEPDSSYLPEGATAKLAKLLERVPRQQAMRVELAASFDPAMSAEETRYDRWLAERRLGRLAEWFDRNAQVKALAVDRSVFEDKGPRRVVVRLHPGRPSPS